MKEQKPAEELGTSSASADPGQASDRPLVNYIWINAQPKALIDLENPVCAIEMGNINRALKNANLYPEADFQIWVDKKLLDDYSLFCLDCFMREKARHGNITLHNLQDIPDYANDPYFVPSSTDKDYLRDQFNNRSGSRNIYSRADLARILVLDHCMRSHPERNRIIYSDTDCHDISLPETLPIMSEHGVAIHDLDSEWASHGYIGLATDNTNVREQFKTLKTNTQEVAHRRNGLGFMAFGLFLKALGMPHATWHDKIGLPDLLPRTFRNPLPYPYTPPPGKLGDWKSTYKKETAPALQPPLSRK